MSSILRKQRVNPKKLDRAKELRQKMTKEEEHLWERLRGNKLNGLHFRRQQVIAGYIVDFYYHSAGLVIEIDGKVHEQQKDEDQKREKVLIDKGLKVIRIRNEEIHTNIRKVLEEILKACS
jgi:very-short-patch-repair endonuclease